MSTVYLHIGTPKTGTTALQNFLPVNEEILSQHGICYPDFGFRYPNVGIHRNAHFLVTTSYRDEQGNRILEREAEDYVKGLDMIEECAKQYPKIIISDEGLWKQSSADRENFWKTLKENFDKRNLDVKIIVYFRRQDLFVQSHWAQKVKEGARYDFHEYLERPIFTDYPLDYYAYMSFLADIFGKEALIIRVFERGQYKGEEKTIQSDFLDIFGLKLSDGFVVEQAVYNTSLEGDYLEMKRILNALPEFHSNKHLLIRNIRKIQDEKFFEHNYQKGTFFAPGEQQKFMERYAESNSKVAKEFLNREDGRLFYDEIEDLPENTIDEKELLRDTILVYGKMADTFYQKNLELEQKLRDLRAEMKAAEKASKERDKELKQMIRELEQTALLFRLKRKTKHLMGKDRPAE